MLLDLDPEGDLFVGQFLRFLNYYSPIYGFTWIGMQLICLSNAFGWPFSARSHQTRWRLHASASAAAAIHFRIKWLLLPTARSISCSDIISFSYFNMAERVGFEPTEVLPSSVFRTDSIGHSDTSPYCRTKCAAMGNSMITIWWGNVKTGDELVTRETSVLMSNSSCSW